MARVLVIRQAMVPLDPRVQRDIEALRMDGHTVDVVSRRGPRDPLREQKDYGVVWRLPALPGRGGPILYVAQYAWFMLLATIWASILQLRRGYDMVQVHSLPDTLVFSAVVPRLMGVPVVLDLQEAMPEFFATKFGHDLGHGWVRLVAAFEQLSTRFATHVLTCTEQMRETFVGRGTPAGKITVILNSADERLFVPNGRANHKHPDAFIVVCHGTIEERYGHEEIVRAVAILRDEIPALKLQIYGDGAQRPAIKQLVGELGIDDRVWFSDGWVPMDQLLSRIDSADAGVVAMRRDAFRDLTHCNKMFDFITMRVPAAVSRTRSVEEYFDEDCFELFESGNAEDLARAFRTLWSDPKRRAQLVEHAAAVNEPYRWPRQQLVYRTAVSNVMATRAPLESAPTAASLYSSNTPAKFWKLRAPEPAEQEWDDAVAASAHLLPAAAAAHGGDVPELMNAVLGEGQFGPRHWALSAAKRVYYDLKPVLPRSLVVQLRRIYGRHGEASGGLDWPQEGRYSDFLYAVLSHVLERRGLESAEYVSFWPNGANFALVLTHDVELGAGHDFVRKVVELEKRYRFRSAFNFVPARYRIDRGLLAELAQDGFEVGVHDLNHDGKLFSSRRVFEQRAPRINAELAKMGASGFRAALLHRNPEWMQELDLDYDLSFFDTDPYEPIPGGTMSIWPFRLGRFLELPTTLVQDYTLTELLGERTPRIWLEKVDFIARRHGMALVNSHPDYLRTPRTWAVYEAFLAAMAERKDAWCALPRDVASWWRLRAEAGGGELPAGGTWARFEAMRPSIEGAGANS